MLEAPALRVEGVYKTYGGQAALRDVSFVLRGGEFCALLGPNGAGKTTLFQLLSGLFTPEVGRIEVMGHDMARDAVAALADLGIVFQYPTLDLELSARDNLMFSAGLQGIARRAAVPRIADVLELMKLTDRADEKAGRLSGGNRRRIELARALLHRPRVLLMDEPTVGLDPASRAHLLSIIQDLRASENISVLWATHLCEEARAADRIIVMQKGEILRDTTPDALAADTPEGTVEAAFLQLTRAPA